MIKVTYFISVLSLCIVIAKTYKTFGRFLQEQYYTVDSSTSMDQKPRHKHLGALRLLVLLIKKLNDMLIFFYPKIRVVGGVHFLVSCCGCRRLALRVLHRRDAVAG